MKDKLREIMSMAGIILLIYSPVIVAIIKVLVEKPDRLISFIALIFVILIIVAFIIALKFCINKIVEACCKSEKMTYIVPILTVAIFIFACVVIAKIFPVKSIDTGANILIAKTIVVVIFIASILYLMLNIPAEPEQKDRPVKKRAKLPPAQNGYEYETRVANWLRDNGFKYVTVTPASGDFGVDITAHKDNIKYAVQCKYYTGKFGVSAVHEVAGGMAHYGCTKGMVVTNSTFTDNAHILARENGIILKENVNL